MVSFGLIVFLFWPQAGNYKLFFSEGRALFEQGEYQQAAEKFQEALRLEPKARMIKVEGAFYEAYQPRYWLGLCYESLDILEAERWVQQSKTALEIDIQKKRKAIAEYNKNVSRIEKMAQSHREQMNAAFRVELMAAQRLLDQDRFQQAQDAFRKLAVSYPDRSEVIAGQENVAIKRQAFVENQLLKVQLALSNGQWDQAESLLDRVEAVDPVHPELSATRQKLVSERQRAQEPVEVVKANPVEQQPIVTQGDVKQPPVTGPSKTTRQQTVPSPDKAEIRAILLESLDRYRLGDPQGALTQLEKDSLPDMERIGSFHWLKGLYLFDLYHAGGGKDQSLSLRADQALLAAIELRPEFSPDPDIYSPLILTRFERIKAEWQATQE